MMLHFGAGCGSRPESKDSDAKLDANIQRGIRPQPDAEVAVIEMENPAYGTMVIELYPNVAPKMVERFKTLVREGFYNGTAFHRINPQEGVLQGGDPNSKDDDPANDGMGDSPYPDLPAEFSDIPFDAGTVGAARQGARPAMRGMPALTEAEAVNTGN